MNRIIKFRAYWKGVNKMVYFDSSTLGYTKEGKVGMFMPSTTGQIYIGKTEPMQFTGLLDKAGKEIYEGSILKCYWLAELGIKEIDCEAMAVVRWNNDEARFFAELIKPYKTGVAEEMIYEESDLPLLNEGYNDNYSFEVIGNIYEHPDLLK